MKNDFDFDSLAVQYTPLIHHIMKQLHIYKSFDEYYQLGLIGLWEASRRFDEQKGRFISFAYQTIKGKMLCQMNRENRYSDNEQSVTFDYWDSLIAETNSFPFDWLIPRNFIQTLTPYQLIWLTEAIGNGKSSKDIASEYTVSCSAVKSWRRTTLQKLRVYAKAYPDDF